MAVLSEVEEAALQEYVSLLVERLGDRLKQVWLFGSAARGDMWGAHSPMQSDIDILVLTTDTLTDDTMYEFVNLTYPFYLECGRQIDPTFKPLASWEERTTDKERVFFDRVRAEGRRIWPRP